MAADPPKDELERYWENIWEKEATPNTNTQWLVDLQVEHSNLLDQDPEVITAADKRVSKT